MISADYMEAAVQGKHGGHVALEEAAKVVPRAHKRKGKGIAKAAAKQAAKDKEDAKAREKAAAKEAAKAHQEQEFLKVHYIGERAPCKHGWGAEVWPGEANLCCKGGKFILNADCNPPLDAAYLDLITQPRYSQQSRALNGGLAMASPPRRWGAWAGTSRPMGTWRSLGKRT